MSRLALGRRRRLGVERRAEQLEDRRLLAIAPLVDDFAGIEQTFDERFFFNNEISPPDPSAAVGPGANGVIVAAVNSEIAIYRKSGIRIDQADLAGSFSTTFFRGVEDLGSLGFRPQVIYDTYSDRFVVTALQNDGGLSKILIAVSTTQSPDDLDTRFGDSDNDWHTYAIETETGFGATLGGFDWARMAADHDSLYIAGNYINNVTGAFQGVQILRIGMEGILSGPSKILQPDTDFDVIPVPGVAFSLTPVESSDRGVSDPQLFVEAQTSFLTGDGQGLRVWQLDDNNLLTSRSISAPYSEATEVPQPQSSLSLTIIGDRLNNAVLRAGSIWTAHTVADPDNGEAIVRWYEIESEGLFQILQSGDVDPGAKAHAFTPAINANYRGDMALTYTQVSNTTTAPAQFPTMMYTTRLAADSPGFTEPGAEIRSGEGAYGLQSWGFQGALALDPTDEETFYAFHEVSVDATTWDTWFGVFRYADPAVQGGFGHVVAQTPSDVATDPPLWIGLEFDQAMLDTSFDLDDVLSLEGPGGVSLSVADYVLGFEWVNDYALRVFLRPLAVDGNYVLTVAPTIFTSETGSPLDQDGDGIGGEPGEDNYLAEFELDLAEIIGIKYHDRNGNGRRDAGEEPLKDWQIYLDTNENGQFDSQTRAFVTQPGLPIPQPNPDPISLISTLDVADLPSQIQDVNVALNITHTFDRDLTVELVSPTGVRVTLFTDIGLDQNDFLGTVLDDEASLSIDQGTAPFTGTFRPLEALAQLDGLDPNGTWSLVVTDNSPGDTGVLVDWAVEIQSSEPSRLTDVNGQYAFLGLPGGTYRVAEVPQEDWIQTEPALPGLKITEIDMEFPDFIEIQNVTDTPINTSGWFVAVSGEPFGTSNINVVNPVIWSLPEQVAAGEIMFRSDSPSNNYFGGNIFWNEDNTRFGTGWVMIVDGAGRIVDWVGWGFDEGDMAAFDVQIQKSPGQIVSITAAQLQAAWQGTTLFITPGEDPSTIKRTGNTDNNRSSDKRHIKRVKYNEYVIRKMKE